MHPVSAGEIRRLARDHGALVERSVTDEDHLGRPDVRWTRMAVRLPNRTPRPAGRAPGEQRGSPLI